MVQCSVGETHKKKEDSGTIVLVHINYFIETKCCSKPLKLSSHMAFYYVIQMSSGGNNETQEPHCHCCVSKDLVTSVRNYCSNRLLIVCLTTLLKEVYHNSSDIAPPSIKTLLAIK